MRFWKYLTGLTLATLLCLPMISQAAPRTVLIELMTNTW